MAAATGSVNGYLTSTDWTTFNGKANAFTYTSNYIPYGQGTTTPTQSVGLQYNGTTFTTTGISTSNNLTFTGTGNRITGDMNNGTLANRLMFQNSVTNGATSVGAMPNGTAASSAYNLFAGSDVANTSLGQFRAGTDTGDVRITSGITGTGTYQPLTMFTGGSERLRIDTSGNCGIGTSSPTAKLTITGINDTLHLYSSNATVYQRFFGSTTTASPYLGADGNNFVFGSWGVAERMRIDSSGNVGIGTTAIAGKFNVGGGRSNFGANSETYSIAVGYTQARCNSGQTYYIGATDSATPSLVFSNEAGTERMRIASNGIVTMNAYGAGAATFSAAGVISSVSDETWKTKDGVPTNPEAMLQKLEAGYWFYNEEKAPIFGSDRQLGFYAQNVHEAIGEEAAPTPEEGKPWGYYDRSVLAITVMSLKNALNSIQELKTELDSVKAELQTLKGS
jgi:hypothetical protein